MRAVKKHAREAQKGGTLPGPEIYPKTQRKATEVLGRNML
jgi:hypothetical protein